MENTEKIERRRGPVPGPKTERYQVLIEPLHAEWAKHQPGGLSEVIRTLLKKAYEEEEEQNKKSAE